MVRIMAKRMVVAEMNLLSIKWWVYKVIIIEMFW